MTTQALSDRKGRGLWNSAYFLGELRRSWANCLLYFLAYFFTLVVPMLDQLASWRRSDFYDTVTIGGSSREIEYFVPAVFVVIAMLIALWAGVSACAYLHKRISAYHFHSMPIRREGILLVKSAVAFSDFILALIPNLAMAICIAALMDVSAGVMLLLALYCLFGFTLAYTFTVMCGMLCGTRSFHLIFTGIAAFVGPALVGSLSLIADTVCIFLRPGYLDADGEIFACSSPFTLVIFRLEQNGLLSPLTFALLCAASILFFAVALILLRIRPTEGAESPVIFKPVGVVLKYVVMSLATVFFGFFFGEIFGSGDFWMIFGMISGAILSFLFMNILIQRNARKMFSGLPGLVAFALCFALSTWGVTAWYQHWDVNAYDADQLASVSIGIHANTESQYTLTSPEAIAAVTAFTDAYFAEVEALRVENPYDSGPIAVEYDIPVGIAVETASADIIEQKASKPGEDYIRLPVADTKTIYITQTPKAGISRTWQLHFDRFPALDALTEALCRTIADSEEFAERYISAVMSPGGELYQTIRDRAEGEHWSALSGEDFIAASADYRAIEAELRSQIGYDFFQQRSVMVTSVAWEHMWFDLPIYESQSAMLRAMGETRTVEKVIEENIQKRKASREDTRLIGVYRDPNTGEMLDYVIVDGEIADEIRRHSATPTYRYGDFFLTRMSRTYLFEGVEDYYPLRFVEGKVPQAVLDLFAKN